jgi:hypothetical protein
MYFFIIVSPWIPIFIPEFFVFDPSVPEFVSASGTIAIVLAAFLGNWRLLWPLLEHLLDGFFHVDPSLLAVIPARVFHSLLNVTN